MPQVKAKSPLALVQLCQNHGTVIVAMSIVLMMQMAVYQVIHMVAMRNRFMATTRSVNVSGIMTAANMPARTIGRIGFIHVQRVFFDKAGTALMMQVPIVQYANDGPAGNCGWVVAMPDCIGSLFCRGFFWQSGSRLSSHWSLFGRHRLIVNPLRIPLSVCGQLFSQHQSQPDLSQYAGDHTSNGDHRNRLLLYFATHRWLVLMFLAAALTRWYNPCKYGNAFATTS